MPKTIKIDKQDSSVSYTGNWTQLGGGNEVQLEDATDIDLGYGRFKNGITLSDGTVGAGALNLKEGVDFEYDKALDNSDSEGYDIYDTNDSGAFDSGKVMRVVADGVNISDLNYPTTGYGGLKAYAKDLTVINSPSKENIYIDPNVGKFVFPRPIYWSKMESDLSITSPEIGDGTTVISGNAVYGAVKFNNGWSLVNGPVSALYPFGTGNRNLTKGTVSLWGHASSDWQSAWLQFFISSNTYFQIYSTGNFNNQYSITANGVLSGTNIQTDALRHIYMVWDSSGGLTGGNTIRLYINGVLTISTSNAISSGQCYLYCTSQAGFGTSVSVADNLKIWNHVVSEDPSFEYNAGAGREDAIHEVYGAANDYKPPTNIDVGYYYITQSGDPARLDASTAGETVEVQLEDASNEQYASGIIGPIHQPINRYVSGTSGVDLKVTPLLETLDWNYNDRLDGLGTLAVDCIDSANASGALGIGTSTPYDCFRIVDDGVNVCSAGGLNLTPIAHDLSILSSPPADEVWIDPATSKFVLPRPVYWSKCETVNNLKIPEIGNDAYLPDSNGFGVTSSKFNNGIAWNGSPGTTKYFYPIGQSISLNGIAIISVWLRLDEVSVRQPIFGMYLNENSYIYFKYNGSSWTHSLTLDSVEQDTDTTSFSTIKHLYIVIDEAANLTTSKSVRVFINDVEVLSSTTSFNFTQLKMYLANAGAASQTGGLDFDNLKIWDHVVSEDPSFEYNGGVGREDALHIIYGATNEYKPKLNTTGGVGYYKPSTAGSFVKWSI